MKKTVMGILAHVDAGKTTLAEGLLYVTGKTRKLGRVDHRNTVMDTHDLERERGITIFASQAQFTTGDLSVTLLDTPGHIDFSAETERVLQVLDYAILVISGIDGVQSHTRTLWRLLDLYRIPVFLFVTKMDFARRSREDLMAELQRELSPNCLDFRREYVQCHKEQLAMCREDVLESYLQTGEVTTEDVSSLIVSRSVFPCYFGSGLKLEGIDEFLSGIETYTTQKQYAEAFGAKVFKITYDEQNTRLTHLKITGGSLRVRDSVTDGKGESKITQIRLYSGSKHVAVDEVSAGDVCCVVGLDSTQNGQGIGTEAMSGAPVLEPIMKYRIVLPKDCDPQTMLPKLRQLEEEDPQLRITWNTYLQQIHVGLMGAVQTEILKSLIKDRFDVAVEIDSGEIVYRETIDAEVEGVGHYEPLRHYAEVHLILEPLARGSGLVFRSACNESVLERNWQRLVLTHLYEKQHIGVLTGSPITDMRITLVAGRAHNKHTEGGDFRQATYRAVRHGLMQANTVLLEPYYRFRLELPRDHIGHAIHDIRGRHGSIEPMEEFGDTVILRGRAPVTTMNDYAMVVASYTKGRGRLSFEMDGYDRCHNPEEVIARYAYDPMSDVENTPDSVFCAHGGGFNVKWDRVTEYMHLESCLQKDKTEDIPRVIHKNLRLDEKELEAIMLREFGPIKRPTYRPPVIRGQDDSKSLEKPVSAQRYLIVDGYNVIFAWEDLKEIAETDLERARNELMRILSNYSAFTKHDVVLVFDAYKVAGNQGKRFDYQNIHVVFTKERELGDVYIEKLIAEIGKNDNVRVVTSDALIQLSAVRYGVLRMSAAEFALEVNEINGKIGEILTELREQSRSTIGDALK